MPMPDVLAGSLPFFKHELRTSALAPLIFVLLLRGGLAALFMAAATAKLQRFARFVRTVGMYRLVPDHAVRAVAYGVIGLELALALMLLAGVEVRAALYASAATLFGFAVAIAVNLIRGRSFDCGCAVLEPTSAISWTHVIANASGASISVAGSLLEPAVAAPIVPALTLVAAGFAAPALIVAERRVSKVTPYRLRHTLHQFSVLHPEVLRERD